MLNITLDKCCDTSNLANGSGLLSCEDIAISGVDEGYGSYSTPPDTQTIQQEMSTQGVYLSHAQVNSSSVYEPINVYSVPATAHYVTVLIITYKTLVLIRTVNM